MGGESKFLGNGMITDWSDAYENGGYIKEAASYPPKWAEKAARFRLELTKANRLQSDLPYGPGTRQVLDLMWPDPSSGQEPQGLMVFVHGGYWKAFDKSSWSHLAAGGLARNYVVALPSYTLAPQARISEITREIATAIEYAVNNVDGQQTFPIRLIGHSAGGHLVSRMVCKGTPLRADIVSRVEKVVSLSGVHDLRPLIRTAMNEILQLDSAEAMVESPALLEPQPGVDITCWVGAQERPEFCRQNDLLANIWHGLGAETASYHEADRHHFDVIDGLESANSPLCRALFQGN